jgi:hypothetical protein
MDELSKKIILQCFRVFLQPLVNIIAECSCWPGSADDYYQTYFII